MKVVHHGQRGRSKSAAKASAARRNGKSGGRPSRAQRLLRRMSVVHDRISGANLDVDPGDLWMIIERLCREKNSGRRFFIRPRSGGGYGF